MSFNAREWLINLQGKDYLPVAPRLIWFREAHPDWGILTDPHLIDTERGIAIFRATILNSDGKVVATATKTETVTGFADYVEKAETGAVGRALAMAGFGTQFAIADFDEGERLADSPQAKSAARPKAAKQSANGDAFPCEWAGCDQQIKGYTSKAGKSYTAGQVAEYSQRDCAGQIFCYHHRQQWMEGVRPAAADGPQPEDPPLGPNDVDWDGNGQPAQQAEPTAEMLRLRSGRVAAAVKAAGISKEDYAKLCGQVHKGSSTANKFSFDELGLLLEAIEEAAA